MAEVRNVRLTAGRVPSGNEFATVEYDIFFTDAERELGLRFDEWVSLYERDDDLDRYYAMGDANIGTRREAVGNQDDHIGQIHFGPVTATASVVHRAHTREWNFPNNEGGAEEYRALVQVYPEIRTGSAWSNEQSINLA
jgi:hypothetical protein